MLRQVAYQTSFFHGTCTWRGRLGKHFLCTYAGVPRRNMVVFVHVIANGVELVLLRIIGQGGVFRPCGHDDGPYHATKNICSAKCRCMCCSRRSRCMQADACRRIPVGTPPCQWVVTRVFGPAMADFGQNVWIVQAFVLWALSSRACRLVGTPAHLCLLVILQGNVIDDHPYVLY
jgi:hypothetical protein